MLARWLSAHFVLLLIGVHARCEWGFFPADRRQSIGYVTDFQPVWTISMKSILGIFGALLCAALLAPSIADARGSGGGGHFSGHSSTRSFSDSDNSGSNALPGVSGDAQAPKLLPGVSGDAQAPKRLPVVATQIGELETDNGIRDDQAILTNLGVEADVESKGAESIVDVGDADERAK
jgi:hypothetical protein